ncbi:lipid A-modifier LpxR family protein [Roseicyclus persicicus]|uniref:Lipid A deacylase LpxR family protein n=1 Tax=Roseicyclus persicicus TaxID=2650661 RepID=A0A7X6GXD1_9RHOB|nr:lipid A-modifier LpxR family protein [Roseibacterium persicicum]NKX44151.1 lipid A deacylase LpxR family protein [Roseibacterium persicicum]
MAVVFPRLGAAVLVLSVLAPAAQAQDGRETLGLVRQFTNDTIADRQDRWRSGGFAISAFRGTHWAGSLPTQPFEIMEYRLRGEVMAPDNLANPAPGDRLYAGTWWLGAHTHFDWQGFEVTAGADIAITGEQSRIRAFQSTIHDWFSMPRMDVENHQVDNGVHLHGTVEVARTLGWGGTELRPFVELQAGAETLARAGFDLTLGNLGQGGLRTRDPITGQRLEGIVGDSDGGWSFLLGADSAWVDSSVFLPADRGYQVEDVRHRVRAGVNYGFGSSNIFYGVTWLSEEFVGQTEGQLVGSLSLGLQF